MEAAREATKGIAKDIGDVLIYALYPTTGLRFLKWKYGLEKPPADTQAKTLEDVKKEDELIAKAKAGKLAEKEAPPSGANVRNFKVYVGNEVYNIGVETLDGGAVSISPAGASKPATRLCRTSSPRLSSRHDAVAKTGRSLPDKQTLRSRTSRRQATLPVLAPMPGIIVQYEVKVGDEVKADDAIVILEAMKMANVITSPVSGKVKAINFKSGDRVPKDAVLAVIG